MSPPLNQNLFEYAYAKAVQLKISCMHVHIWTNYTVTVEGGDYTQSQIDQFIFTVNAYGRSLCNMLSGFDPDDFNNPKLIL